MKWLAKYWWFIVAAVLLILIGIDRYKKMKLGRSTAVESISYLGDPVLPRGIRNNNPGNLVRSGIAWDGKIPHSQSTDAQFEQFYYYWQGVRAMIKDIINDITTDGTNTIRMLIYRYAPPMENHTEQYIDFVSDRSGISPDDILAINPDQLYPVISAMAEFENGEENAINRSMFNYAYSKI